MNRKTIALLSNTAIYGIGNLVVKIVQFFLLPLYTSLLNTSEYAISDLFNNTVEIALPILTLSITDAVFRFSMDKDAKSEELFASGSVIVAIGISICSIICAVYAPIFRQYPVWLFLPLYAAAAIRLLISQYVRSAEKIKEYAIAAILNAVSMILFAMLFLSILKMGISGYILSIIFANICSAIYLLMVSRTLKSTTKMTFNWTATKGMLSYSVPLIPNTISWWLTNTASKYIIIVICGTSVGGLFAAASKIPALINVCINTFQQAWVMSAIKEYESDNDIEFQSKIFQCYNGVLFIIGGIVILLSPWICRFLLSDVFYPSWKFVPFLVISALIGGWASFFGAFYSAAKKNIMSTVSTLAGGVSNVLLCLYLAKQMGVYGALIASVTSYFVISVIRIITTRKYVPIQLSISTMAITLCLTMAEAFFISLELPWSTAAASACFFMVLVINWKSIKHIIKQIIGRIKK